MAAKQSNRLWAVLIVFLIIVIIAGGMIAWSQYQQHQPTEISLTTVSRQAPAKLASISGAVASPGLYALKADDTIQTLVQAAGGIIGGTTPDSVDIYVPAAGEGEQPQRININRAEAWLLEALPGIGEVKAKAIITYRQQNGPFRQASQVALVEGIGPTIYEKIKDFISVTD